MLNDFRLFLDHVVSIPINVSSLHLLGRGTEFSLLLSALRPPGNVETGRFSYTILLELFVHWNKDRVRYSQ